MQKQILVVEDNELNRMILCEILSGSYRVSEAKNGQEALEILNQHKDSIDLILLDLMMPVMDGYAFLDRVREDAELSLIPIIVTTQSDSEEDEISALDHGATDFVPKPYRPKVILHRVASLIKLRETAAMVNQFKYDRLTGLYSKEYFYQQVRELLDANAKREFTIICSDIENFKLYNDTFGREAGDRLLQKDAAALKEFVGEGVLCGRYGADCFLFLWEREKERSYRESYLGGADYEYPEKIEKAENIAVNIGVYEITDRSLSAEQMCDRAILAAKSTKGYYNQHYAVYDDMLRNKLLREKAITDAMETALDEEQFAVYYQPKFNLNDDCMAGAEALVRWVHPEWGFLSPGEFIPLFEKNGFISQLDQYVWERVCAQLRDWQDNGRQLLPVSVNVSRSDVFQSHLVDTLWGLIQKYGIDPMYLHLEITESAYADNPAQIFSTVDKLRSLGFIVEMDDFGSGYSSLNMLSQMSLDILKLDMKFIQNEIEKPLDQSILNDVVSMAHKLHLSVVAEGVETSQQVRRLRDTGCDYAQGYYFAKPLPVADFEELWRSRESRPMVSLSKILQNTDGMPVLLAVDEDAEYRKKLRQVFAGQYNVLEASDAESALACIKSDKVDCVSAVFLSMTLPKDGAAMLLSELRANPAYCKLPVIATVPAGESPETLPLSLQADDCYCKEHPIDLLRRRLQRLIERTLFEQRAGVLQDQAKRDQLTGLLNRRGLNAAMAELRKEDLPSALYLFDLDNLKTANDTGGHHIGDRMICNFAELLCRYTNSEDIICRYGGDEFIVILKRMSDEETVIKKGEEICKTFRDCYADEAVLASCSAGITVCGRNETPSIEMIERADKALYRAKQENKGGCCLWRKQ